MSIRVLGDRLLVAPTAARRGHRTALYPKPARVDRAGSDLDRRLALWLADVAVEAALTPLREPEPPKDGPLSGPTPE